MRDEKVAEPLESIQKTLAHHDGLIGNLAGRMSGVENGLRSAVDMMKEMRAETAKGFSDLSSTITSIRSEQGPGLGKMLGYLVAGATLLVMASGAITILVTSFVSPELRELKTVGARHESYLDQVDRAVRDELRDLRRSHDERIQERLERLESLAHQGFPQQQGWTTSVAPAKR